MVLPPIVSAGFSLFVMLVFTEISSRGVVRDQFVIMSDKKIYHHLLLNGTVHVSPIGVPTTTLNMSNDDTVDALADDLETRLNVNIAKGPILICDAGYGIPREARPRKEKILAIARQLTNFLQWQHKNKNDDNDFAEVRVVACQDETIKQALEDRTRSLLLTESEDADADQAHEKESASNIMPQHLSFSCESLEDACCRISAETDETVIYLSPDAEEAIDPSLQPPRFVVVGLLIDRRIQPRRSQERATKLDIVAKRWPLDDCFRNIAANEPLNVDCIMEGMQQWWWNSGALNCVDSSSSSWQQQQETFIQAAGQAIQHHADRHPSRPIHKKV